MSDDIGDDDYSANLRHGDPTTTASNRISNLQQLATERQPKREAMERRLLTTTTWKYSTAYDDA